MRSPHLTPTDEELVARALAGEGEAFGQLFDRHVRLVRATLMGGVRDEATLQDLSQETFVRAYRKLSHLRDRAKFKSWIVGIARNVAMEFSRSRKRDRHEYTASVVDIAEVPAYHQSEKQIEQVLQMLDELPETERLAIQLFYLDGHNADLTAELLGMSRSNVYATVKRACGRLANAIPTLMRGGEKS